MKSVIQTKLRQCLKIRRYTHFYRPDGIAPPTEPRLMNGGYDRLLFVLSGKKSEQMSLAGRLQTITLTAGDVYLIGRNVWEYANMTTPHELLCIVPRGAYFRVSYYNIKKKVQRSAPWPKAVFHHTNTPPDNAILHVLQAMKTADTCAINDLVHAAVSLAMIECEKSALPLKKSYATFEQIQNYIDIHFTQDLTRDSIANTFGLNPAYISQLFKQITGNTFSNYLCTCRMSYAQKLLLSTQSPIKQIAVLCGYSEEVYFVRRFREVVGISPGRYRSQATQQAVSTAKP